MLWIVWGNIKLQCFATENPHLKDKNIFKNSFKFI